MAESKSKSAKIKMSRADNPMPSQDLSITYAILKLIYVLDIFTCFYFHK